MAPAAQAVYSCFMQDDIAFARSVLTEEANSLSALARALGDDFLRAAALLADCPDRGGSVLVTGLGKSGLVGAKISATLSSLGIPAHSVHPSEAAHGDLGRFRPADVVIAISASGETIEVVTLASILKQDGLAIIGISARRGTGPTSLERLSTVHLCLGIESEAGGPRFVAPTSSTTATMALGDALALCAARRRNFTNADFAKRHPGGALGGLLRPVADLLRFRAGVNLPLISRTQTVSAALEAASRVGRRPGAMVVIDEDGNLAGLFTDGDLRRLVMRNPAELSRPIGEVMTRNPRTLPENAVVQDAVRMFSEHRQDEIPVVMADGKPLGVLDVQDLIAMRLVSD